MAVPLDTTAEHVFALMSEDNSMSVKMTFAVGT